LAELRRTPTDRVAATAVYRRDKAASAAAPNRQLSFEAALASSCVALILLGGVVNILVPVDEAIALPVDWPNPLLVVAGVAYWTGPALGASAIQAAMPGGGTISLSALTLG
jgi:hypothetical protein